MVQSLPILAATFVTPAFFIAGLALISIPIIIHILNRRRFKTVTWAAMEYLLRAMRKNRRRLKFEQMLLLVTRCLVLALLGAALARPIMCENRAMNVLGGRTGLNVFVIDNSYSMAYQANRPDAPTHLAQAKKIAKALIDQLSAGSESVAVIATARPLRAAEGPSADDEAIIVRPGYDLQAAKDAIDRIQQSYADTDLPNALQLAQRIGADDGRQAERRLILISDGTRSAFEGPQAQALQQLGQGLAKTFHITHYNLTEGRQQANLAASGLTPDSNLVTTKFGASFAAHVNGYGNAPEASLRWTLNDAPLPDTPARKYDATPIGDVAVQPGVTPGGNAAVQSGARFTSGGPQVITVSVLGNDPLREDDTRRRVVNVAAELKVLIVQGQAGSNPLEGSGTFLHVALSPPRDAAPGVTGTNSYVSAELISDIELGNEPLEEYGAVILAGVGNILPAQADGLAKFVKQGGTLMLFMGEAINSENYNSILLPRKLMPGSLVKRMSTAQDEEGFLFEFPPQGVPHPFLRLFHGEENTGLDTARVFTYWQADVPTGSEAERVLNYLPRGESNAATRPAAGAGEAPPDPAITVHALGRGRVVFFSTTANSEWTTLPAKPNYVTLVHELLQGSVRAGDYWMNLAVGQPLEIPPTIRLTAPPTLLDPAKKPVVLEVVTAQDGQQVYRSRPLGRPGLYTLATGNRAIPIAVNLPPTESDVRTIGNEGVKKALGDIDITLRGDQIPAQAAAAETGNDLSWIVMAAVFFLLLAECYMAMRFGHYRRPDIRPQPLAA